MEPKLAYDTAPERIRGTAPKWWNEAQPVFAYGPFVVERTVGRAIIREIGILLTLRGQGDPDAIEYSVFDRRHPLDLTGITRVKNGVLALQTTVGTVIIRPLRTGDERLVLGVPAGLDLRTAIQQAFNW